MDISRCILLGIVLLLSWVGEPFFKSMQVERVAGGGRGCRIAKGRDRNAMATPIFFTTFLLKARRKDMEISGGHSLRYCAAFVLGG